MAGVVQGMGGGVLRGGIVGLVVGRGKLIRSLCINMAGEGPGRRGCTERPRCS